MADDNGSPWNSFVISDGPGAARINADAIKQARDQGYSNDDIAGHLAQVYPKLLVDHLVGDNQQQPSSQALPPLPDGYEIEHGPWENYAKQSASQSLPPLPPGFQLEEGAPPWEKYRNLPSQISEARKNHYTDDEITGFLSQKYPDQFKEAAGAGYSPTEILDHLGGIAVANAPVTASGSAKAIGSGVAKGAADIPSGIIALGNLLRRVDPLNLPGMVQQQVAVPGVLNKLSRAADNLYTPQNSVERGLKTAAEWAPAVVSGPEGFAGKGMLDVAKVLTSRAIKQAAIPAAASEAAGKVTEGTQAEPYARAAAALIAGGLGTGAKPEALSAADVAGQVNRDFDAFRSAPVTIKPGVVEDAAKDIQNSLTAAGLSKAPANDLVAPYIGRTTPVSLNELQTTRSLLGRAAKGDTPEAVAAGRAKSAIDQLMDRLQPTDTVVGANALPDAMAALRQGRANAAVQNRLEPIEDAAYHGQINAGVHSGDVASALRQQINSLLKSQQAMRKLEPYRTDMEKIARGTPGLNAIRTAARLTGGTGGWHSGPWWLGALLAEPVSGTAATAMAAMPFAGMGLKKIEAARTLNRVRALQAKIGARAQGLPQPATGNPGVARAIIAALNANGGNRQ